MLLSAGFKFGLQNFLLPKFLVIDWLLDIVRDNGCVALGVFNINYELVYLSINVWILFNE